MMFQSYALFPHMTVEQNIAFGLKQDGAPALGDRRPRGGDARPGAAWGSFGRRRPRPALRRPAPARGAGPRAGASSPKMLLLDEPLGALDKKLREHTQFELVNIQEQARHHLRHGHPRPGGGDDHVDPHRGDGRRPHRAGRRRPSEIYEYPASRFVAEFIGAVNMPGRHRGGLGRRPAGRARARAGASDIAATRAAADPARHRGQRGRAAGEDRRLARPPPTGQDNVVAGKVADIAYLGDVSIYHVRTRIRPGAAGAGNPPRAHGRSALPVGRARCTSSGARPTPSC